MISRIVVIALAGILAWTPAAGASDSGQTGRRISTMTTVPSCRSKADIERLTGRRCLVVGIYRQIDVRMRKQPPRQYRGHAAVELADGVLVALEPSWSKAAVRDKGERARFDGKPVEVTGGVHIVMPAPSEPAARATGPAISPVELVAPGQ